MESSPSPTKSQQAVASLPVKSQDHEESSNIASQSHSEADLRPSSAYTTLADETQHFGHENQSTVEKAALENPSICKDWATSSAVASGDPQVQLSQARQALVKNEMHHMLCQVQGLEQRISKTYDVLTDQERELSIREAKIAQREGWLRKRENSVLRRERNAQRRESELLDLETASQRTNLKSNAKDEIEARDHSRKSSLSSAPALLRSLTGRKKTLSIGAENGDDESASITPEALSSKIQPSMRERYQRDGEQVKDNGEEVTAKTDAACLSEQGEDSSNQAQKSVAPLIFRSASLDDGQLPGASTESTDLAVSKQSVPHSSSDVPQTSNMPETPVRQTPRSFIQRLSPFTPRTPPPPYPSPTAFQLWTTSTQNLTFLTRARTTGQRIFNLMLHPLDPNDESGRRKQRRMNKLEQELQEARARLEKARRDERQKAVERVRELQGP